MFLWVLWLVIVALAFYILDVKYPELEDNHPFKMQFVYMFFALVIPSVTLYYTL